MCCTCREKKNKTTIAILNLFCDSLYMLKTHIKQKGQFINQNE